MELAGRLRASRVGRRSVPASEQQVRQGTDHPIAGISPRYPFERSELFGIERDSCVVDEMQRRGQPRPVGVRHAGEFLEGLAPIAFPGGHMRRAKQR